MNKLTDITVYYEPDAKDNDLRTLSNYVSELYHSKLNGYKPPKTSRVSLMFHKNSRAAVPMFAGSVCCYHFPFDRSELDLIPERREKYKFLLDKIHAACIQLSSALNWDREKFDNAYDGVLRSDLRLIKEYKKMNSRNRKHWAQCILEKTENISTIKFVIGNGAVEDVQVLEKKNWYLMDSVNRIGDNAKWIDNDTFGVKDTKSGRYLLYSISQRQIWTNFTLANEWTSSVPLVIGIHPNNDGKINR